VKVVEDRHDQSLSPGGMEVYLKRELADGEKQ
jgi:hypothetical protein